MAIDVAAQPYYKMGGAVEGFPMPPLHVDRKDINPMFWAQLEPATEPVLSFETTRDLSEDLLLRCSRIGHVLMSSAEMELLSPATQLMEKISWSSLGCGWSVLASEVEVSDITGCWGNPNAYRDEKGYAFTWNPINYDLESRHTGKFRAMRLHQVAYTLMRRQLDPDFELAPHTPLDHKCRFPGCCNPMHVVETNISENNRLQRVAHPIEAALLAGQVMLAPTGYDQIDAIVSSAPNEDTNLVVNTRHGPYRIMKVDDEPLQFYGRPEADNLLPLMRSPSSKLKQMSGDDLTQILNGKKPNPQPRRKSRAKTPVIFENQLVMFNPTRFRKRPATKSPKKASSNSKLTPAPSL